MLMLSLLLGQFASAGPYAAAPETTTKGNNFESSDDRAAVLGDAGQDCNEEKKDSYCSSDPCILREPQAAEVAATQGLTLAEERGFPYIRNLILPLLGWARAQLGRAGEGVALIRDGLAGQAEIGSRVFITEDLTLLAEALALDGKLDDALITIDDALHANPEELVFRPNALTCRGELRLKVGHAELAEADFRDAIALAQKMNAKAWELRATISLARLLDRTDRRDGAHAMLDDIYNWFAEGFDTLDLKDAKALLAELSN